MISVVSGIIVTVCFKLYLSCPDKYCMVIKEYTPKESIALAKKLVKEQSRNFKPKDMTPGNILFTHYNAKDKKRVYDKTPMMMILGVSPGHTLGLNFHWLPYTMRIALVKEILKVNKSNIRNNRKLEFNYAQLKPFLKKHGYSPCIRCYINSRIRKHGVVVGPENMLGMARFTMPIFTGNIPTEKIYAMARKGRIQRNH